ncbi:ligand-binding receptor [Alkalilimnicola ehrlichii]|uniref:Ligand-binding receptor n=1 Tax=Alkalilimnicola ehrlichii TaxID=351052 RepID=A0A3E0WJI6_9GAMM|nr:ABC transporter substrate-binding protein [Alkalilimnicola ehrlichii]RFA25527.1 ligand-binding receptor [Alkalilimnicola ehrlichii]RFA32619.1 ligand-binding receptor [Alkalilimnicola ehrlichii]
MRPFLVLVGALIWLLPLPALAEIRVGMVAPLSGPAASLGVGMKQGIEAHFAEVNRAGGINGKRLRLVARDDQYEPQRSAPATRELIEQEGVVAMIGNVGTPTAIVTIPLHNQYETLLYGAFTGAGVLRRNPPDRYVINYRASYFQETAAMIDGLLEAGVRPDEIAFFTQNDGFGDAGYNGGMAALRERGMAHPERLAHGRFTRNTVNIHQGLATILEAPVEPRAIVMVGTYAPMAEFIREARKDLPNALFLNVSFVGSHALMTALGSAAEDVIVTQVVPPYDADLPAVAAYRDALHRYDSGASFDFVSLEGYLAAKLFTEALRRAKTEPDREAIVEAMLSMGEVDLGVGELLHLGPGDHQASNAVWPTQIRNGRFEPVNWSNLLD